MTLAGVQPSDEKAMFRLLNGSMGGVAVCRTISVAVCRTTRIVKMAIIGHALGKEISFSLCVCLVAEPKRGWVRLDRHFTALLGELYADSRSRDSATNSNHL